MKTPTHTRLNRKTIAPRNLAAKSLRQGSFEQRVEKDPRAYVRKGKYRPGLPLEPEDEV
ncbi:MAG: hypothetical protein JWR75_2080 [Devosia sp.]|nr:hypothetical protein [Devosia sp.]